MSAYVTPTAASTYFATRLYISDWEKANLAERTAALAMAQREIDALPLIGTKAVSTQTDQFPRAYTVCTDTFSGTSPATFSSYSSVDLTVPQAVKDAECEEALALLKYGDSERVRLQEQGVTSASRGDLHETYAPRNGLISPVARELLRPWVQGVVSLTT
jgi:hypothetical protein